MTVRRQAPTRHHIFRASGMGFGLQAAAQDFNRVMHELMTLQRQRETAEPAPHPIAANAASRSGISGRDQRPELWGHY